MPKKEIQDYIFYKIVCLDDSVDLFYVGSTANWKARNYSHKRNCTNEKSDKYNTKVYKTIRANSGWDNFKMIEIGRTEQLTLRQAEKIEEYYRVELKASMNGRRCYLSEEQKRELKKEYGNEYYKNNKDKILEQAKEYREQNKDKIKQRDNKYYKNNTDKIKEKHKKYREANEEAIKANKSEKITCQCGCEVTRSVLARHKKSQNHINIMAAG